MYNYYQPQTQYAPPRTAFLKGRQVASIDEVRAQTIDFDGSVFYFPDIANKKIYTKQINLDGTASLNEYDLIEKPIVEEKIEYVTKKEFEDFINKLAAVPSGGETEPKTAIKKGEKYGF